MDRRSARAKLALLRLAEELGNVSEACRIMGFSRDSYYRFRRAWERGGEAALQTAKRQAVRGPRISRNAERVILDISLENPDWGRRRVATEAAKEEVNVSPSTVRNVWLRHRIDSPDSRRTLRQWHVRERDYLLSDN